MLKPCCEKQHLNRPFFSLIYQTSLLIYPLNSILPLRQISIEIWKLEKRLLLLLRHGSAIYYGHSAFYISTKTSYKKKFKNQWGRPPLPAGKRTKLSFFKADTPIS